MQEWDVMGLGKHVGRGSDPSVCPACAPGAQPHLCWHSSCLLHLALQASLSVPELMLIAGDKLQLLSNDVLGTLPLHLFHVWHFFVKPEETVLINDHSEHLVFSLNNL